MATPIDLSSDDSATTVHVAHDEEIKATRSHCPNRLIWVTGSDACCLGSSPKIETMPTLKPIFTLIEIPLSNENAYVTRRAIHKAILKSAINMAWEDDLASYETI